MRFHGDHIGAILPCLFEKDDNNQKFIGDKKLTKQMGEIFDDAIIDNNFEPLYDEVTKFEA
eukprot:CAMPEP_0201576008 /NCGR_PEP_ID=MMETSP0190_2-20130828/21553_1 /ASSEMBLY_ACC=CAM_ASM_000263 /TAXON_ID=37353 /ORGANISM="Rosalina sp." /LENGTH=60 /DNA_ID=CAMNT_0048006355 /DNA_START=318 /DNA_END=500 /DNA_ORIENTATION=-